MGMYYLQWLQQRANENMVEINGGYYPCRPVDGSLLWRIRAAWWVLTGRADAFTWPAGQ